MVGWGGLCGRFLTVLTSSLFVLINTSVTRGARSGFPRRTSVPRTSTHLFRQKVLQSFLLPMRAAAAVAGGGNKFPK